MTFRFIPTAALTILIAAAPSQIRGQYSCSDLPTHAELTAALKASIAPTGGPSNGGLDFHAWAVVVNRDGEVCAVTKSGDQRGDQFPISRLAAAFKATTVNGGSLDGVAFSTVNIHGGVQPGAALYSLELASPPDPHAAYLGSTRRAPNGARLFGTLRDPLIGKVVGGFSTLGGGLPLYSSDGRILGGLGIGGDTACADHNIAWRVREALGLDNVTFGPNPVTGDDGILYDVGPDGKSASGVGYPFCGFGEPAVAEQIGAGAVAAP